MRNKLLLFFIFLLCVIPISTAQITYHRPVSTGDTSPHVGSDINEASGVTWYAPQSKWFLLEQSVVYVFEHNGTQNLSTSSFSCNGQGGDHEGITTINETSDVIIIQTEGGAGNTNAGVCIVDADDIIDGSTVTVSENFAFPSGDTDCGNGRPVSGGSEGVAFVPDSSLEGICRYGGFLLAQDQNAGSGTSYIYKYCINMSASTLNCMERWRRPYCNNNNEAAALDYDYNQSLLYVLSDNGNAVCVADPFDFNGGYLFTIPDPNTGGGRTNGNGFEGVGFGNGSFVYADDQSGATNDAYNGLWLYAGNSSTLNYPQFSNFRDNNYTYRITSGSVQINTTIVITNGTVFLEINGTNYTATNLTKNQYNVSVNLPNGTYSYYWGSWRNDSTNSYNTSGTKYYTADAVLPIINLQAPANGTITSSANHSFNVTFSDNNALYNSTFIIWNSTGSSVWNVTGMETRSNINTTLSGTSGGINLTVTLPYEGTFYWNYLVFDLYGNGAFNATNYTITYSITDSEYPIFYNLQTSPANNTAYVSGASYQFNTTINNTNATAGIEFNSINYSATNLSNVFNSTISNLAAGTYSYYFWAFGNGSSNNYNTSSIQYYTVAQATPSLTYLLNGANSNLSITYPQQVNASGATTGGTLAIYRDGVSITNSANYTLGVGYYQFDFNVTGNQNYTNVSATLYANVTKASQSITPLLNGANSNLALTFPQQINASFSGTNQTALTIRINGTSVNIAQNYTWGVGSWVVNYSAPSNQNYSSYSAFLNITISQASSSTNGTINGTQGNFSSINGSANQNIWINATNLTGYGSGTISINGSVINSGTFPLSNRTNLSIGFYNITFTFASNQNYSSSTQVLWVNITVAPDTTLPSITSLTESPSDPAVYSSGASYQFNSTISDTNLQSVLIEFNGTNYTPTSNGNIYNFSVSNLGAGTYSYYWRANDTAGNTNTTSVQTYTISQAGGEIRAFINNSRANFTSLNGSATQNIYLNASLQNGTGTITLYLNGSIINSGTSPLSNRTNLSVGFYNVTAVYFGNTNFTSSIETWWINVTISTPDTIPPQVTILSPSAANYSDSAIQFNVSLNENGLCNYTLNSGVTNYTMSSTNSQNFNSSNGTIADGYYTARFYCWDTSSNLNNSESVTFNLDRIFPVFFDSEDNSGTLTDSGTAILNVSVNNTNGTVLLEFNGVNYTATNLTSNLYNVSLSVSSGGTYSYYWISFGNGSARNYNTTSSQSYSVSSSGGGNNGGGGGGGGGGSGGGGSFPSSLSEGKTYAPTSDELKFGYTQALKKKDKISFNIKLQQHSVSIIEIHDTWIEILVESEPQEANLILGTQSNFDLDSDNLPDLTIGLEKILGFEATLTLKEIPELQAESPIETTPEKTEETQTPEKTYELSKILITVLIVSVILLILLISTILIIRYWFLIKHKFSLKYHFWKAKREAKKYYR